MVMRQTMVTGRIGGTERQEERHQGVASRPLKEKIKEKGNSFLPVSEGLPLQKSGLGHFEGHELVPFAGEKDRRSNPLRTGIQKE